MQVKYKEGIKHATAISDPPELERLKENQKNISNVGSHFPKYCLLFYWLAPYMTLTKMEAHYGEYHSGGPFLERRR